MYFYEGVNHFSTYPKNDKMIFKYIVFEKSSGSAEYVFEEKNFHHIDGYEYLQRFKHLEDYIDVYDFSIGEIGERDIATIRFSNGDLFTEEDFLPSAKRTF